MFFLCCSASPQVLSRASKERGQSFGEDPVASGSRAGTKAMAGVSPFCYLRAQDFCAFISTVSQPVGAGFYVGPWAQR